MPSIDRFFGIALTAAMVVAAPAAADDVVDLDGTVFTVVQKPNFTGHCPSGVADVCDVIELVGLGTADWAYTFGPLFEPSAKKRCFDVDGTFTITLHSDGSAISGPLTGVFCPRLAEPAHEHAGRISYGNPSTEDDIIQFETGTGQFAGLRGTASFHQFTAGAVFRGTLTGTLGP